MWAVVKSILAKLLELGLFLWRHKQQELEELADEVKTLRQAGEDAAAAQQRQEELTDYKKKSTEEVREAENQLREESSRVECVDLVDLINGE